MTGSNENLDGASTSHFDAPTEEGNHYDAEDREGRSSRRRRSSTREDDRPTRSRRASRNGARLPNVDEGEGDGVSAMGGDVSAMSTTASRGVAEGDFDESSGRVLLLCLNQCCCSYYFGLTKFRNNIILHEIIKKKFE